MRSLVALAILFAVAGCATPEARLRTGLIEAGLSRNQSGCMAQRMVDRLSLIQLRRIASLKNFGSDSVRGMTVDRFLHNIRSLQDPEILAVTTRAALGCAISG